MKFKAYQSEDNQAKAAAIVADHMKWFNAIIADTFDAYEADELAGYDFYQNCLREPMIIEAAVATMTAEEVIDIGNTFEISIHDVAKSAGFADFRSLVDGMSKRARSVRARYAEM